MDDDKKPKGEPAPVFKKTDFPGFATLYTRKGSGLVDDDLMGYLAPKPGETMHLREEPEDAYSKGGRVRKHGSDTMVKCKNKFS